MTRWADAARGAGVAFDAGAAFMMNGTATSNARLGFACLTEHEAAPGCETGREWPRARSMRLTPRSSSILPKFSLADHVRHQGKGARFSSGFSVDFVRWLDQGLLRPVTMAGPDPSTSTWLRRSWTIWSIEGRL